MSSSYLKIQHITVAVLVLCHLGVRVKCIRYDDLLSPNIDHSPRQQGGTLLFLHSLEKCTQCKSEWVENSSVYV
jgi:hypothetical protein